MLNLPSIFSCYRQNESGRLIMSPLLWHCVYVGRNKLLFLWGELEKKNPYVICVPRYCHQELL